MAQKTQNPDIGKIERKIAESSREVERKMGAENCSKGKKKEKLKSICFCNVYNISFN